MKGDFVVFLDHDDVMADGTLKILYDTLRRDSDIDYVQANVQDFISPELSETDKKTLAPAKNRMADYLRAHFCLERKYLIKSADLKKI